MGPLHGVKVLEIEAIGPVLRQVLIFNAPFGAFLYFAHHLAHHLQNVPLRVARKQQAVEVQI